MNNLYLKNIKITPYSGMNRNLKIAYKNYIFNILKWHKTAIELFCGLRY